MYPFHALLSSIAALLWWLSSTVSTASAATPVAAFTSGQHLATLSTTITTADSANDDDDDDDWEKARSLVRSFRFGPSPALPPEIVAIGCIRSLQSVDYPTEKAGLERIYPFLTWNCIKHIVGCNNESGQLGGVERFCELGSMSPVFQPLFGATHIDIDFDNMTLMPGTLTRGTIAALSLQVTASPIMIFQHKSGMLRDGISQSPPKTDMVIRLQQERRPPLAGCWLVRDIIDARYAGGGHGWGRHEGV